jgi:AraC-like DNA-binding protein
MRGGSPVEVVLSPREALVAAPHVWITNNAGPNDEYDSLGVVLHQNMTRLILIRYRGDKVGAGRRPGDIIDDFVNLPLAIDDEGRRLCLAILQPRPTPLAQTYRTALLGLVFCKIRELLLCPAPPASPDGKAAFSWRSACHFVTEHCGEPIGRDDVARFLRIHPNHVSRLFACFAGQTFSEYLEASRLRRAQELLSDPRLNVSEVSRLCGFASPSYFIRRYRRHFGVTPGRSRA